MTTERTQRKDAPMILHPILPADRAAAAAAIDLLEEAENKIFAAHRALSSVPGLNPLTESIRSHAYITTRLRLKAAAHYDASFPNLKRSST